MLDKKEQCYNIYKLFHRMHGDVLERLVRVLGETRAQNLLMGTVVEELSKRHGEIFDWKLQRTVLQDVRKALESDLDGHK